MEKIKAIYQTEMERVFKLLSNPTRLNILYLLEQQELSVNELVDYLDLPQPQISHNLAILKAHQLVTYRREGKKNLYKLDDSHILDVIDSTKKHAVHVVEGREHRDEA